MRTYADATEYLAAGRSKDDRPLANNTRLQSRGDDIAVRLHATDVVTYRPDGTVALSAGAGHWHTKTTMDRIRTYSGARLYSERNVWYVRTEPDANDSELALIWRSIPTPYEANDPGGEPVKSADGCMVGTVTYEIEHRRDLLSKYDIECDGIEPDEPYEHESGYFVGYRVHDVNVATRYRTDSYAGYGHKVEPVADADETREVQCQHCAAFDALHRAWDLAYNGESWGRNSGRGYRRMTELLAEYGSREAWKAAALADFRAVRSNRQSVREWEVRNRVLFVDDITVNADGYAQRPDARRMAKDVRKRAKLDREVARIDKFVDHCIAKVAAGKVPMPSNGDCWFCLGMDDGGSPDHLAAHMRERYVVPSMLINALRFAGYPDAGIGISLGMAPDATHLSFGFSPDGETVKRALRRYLMRRLLSDSI